MHRTLLILFALAAAALALGGSRSPDRTLVGEPSAEHVDRRPAPPGPHQDAPAARASDTPHGLPPASERAQGHAHRIVDADPIPADPNPDEEIETGEAQNATSSKLLTYRGGPVQTAPRIYLILWGSSWSTSAGDPYGVANRLHYLYGGLGGSTWANVLKQYTSNYGSFTNPTGQYKGYLRDTSYVPAKPTVSDIQAVVQRAANQMADYGYNAQYVVAMPWGVADQKSTANHWCGWHDWKYASGSSWVTYTALPYEPYMDRYVYGCGGGSVNGATNGVLDGVSILAGHEYAETVNDPGLNAWLDADNSENGDKCSWVNLGNRTLANGYSFPMQPTWSNQWRNQYQYGCYFS